MTLRALLVEDEPLAREHLRELLARHPQVEIVGEAATATEARREIAARAPDLLFLDIRLPGEDAFGLLSGLTSPPLVVFTTAYDRYAVRAFEIGGIDYLLKPVAPEALARALERAERWRSGGLPAPSWERLETLLRSLQPESGASDRIDRIGVRIGDRILFIPLDQISYFAAEGRYVRAHTDNGKAHLTDITLSELEARLDPRQFVRIHRALLVNLDQVREAQRWFGGRLRLVLLRPEGAVLVTSRNHAKRLRELFRF